MKIERDDIKPIRGGKLKIERLKPPPKGMEWPNFNGLFNPEDPNPIDGIDWTGDPEVDAQMELGATENAFIENEQQRLEAYRMTLDPEFFFVVCFQSREQKAEFLQKAGFAAAGLGDKYLDGLRVAKFMDIDIKPIPLQKKTPKPMPKPLRGFKIIKQGGDKNP